jgi:hypothetical protein
MSLEGFFRSSSNTLANPCRLYLNGRDKQETKNEAPHPVALFDCVSSPNPQRLAIHLHKDVKLVIFFPELSNWLPIWNIHRS